MWSVRRAKNRYTDETVRPDSTRKVTDVRAPTAGPAKRNVSREAGNVIVVGPPGCCGCVTKSVSSASQAKS
jgi:hypothetical protein